jgi:citrate lyase beta subunit
MKSYFFIPANKAEFLKKASFIAADEIIIDLEDSIFNSNISEAIKNIFEASISNDYFLRIPGGRRELILPLVPLFKTGFSRIILPKVTGHDEVLEVIDILLSEGVKKDDIEIICLIENAKAVLDLERLLIIKEVKGIGVGSHDYCASIKMSHSIENLYWFRMQLLNYARAFGKIAIDMASMNLTDSESFLEECKDGNSKGFDGKFIIHPLQLKLLNSQYTYTKEEIEFSKKVKDFMDEIGGIHNFTIANIDGKVIEKVHLEKINNILKNIGYEQIYNGQLL